MTEGLSTTKGNFEFNGKTARIVDESLATEIDTQHGLKGSGDVWVHQDENLEWHEHHDGNTDGRKVGIHHYTFAGIDKAKAGGNERVKVKTAEGFTFISREIAEEEGYEIVSGKVRNNRDAKYGKRKNLLRNIAH
jgi:hypothetical protein